MLNNGMYCKNIRDDVPLNDKSFHKYDRGMCNETKVFPGICLESLWETMKDFVAGQDSQPEFKLVA
jgi:hypothetical protein